MARLDWQNVNAPDFSPAMQGIQIAANLMSRATDSAQTAFKDIDKGLNVRDQQEYARRLAALGTSEAATAAMTDGSLFAGLRRLSAEDIGRGGSIRNNLQAYEGEGLNQRLQSARGERDEMTFGRENRERDARNAATPILNDIDRLTREGKLTEADALRTANAGVLGGVDWNAAKDIRDTQGNAASAWRTGRFQDQSYNNAEWTQNRTEESYNDQQAIATRMVDLVKNGATWEDAEASILTDGKLNPRQMMAALGQARGMFQPLANTSTGSGATTATGGSGDDYGDMLVTLESGGNPTAQPRNPDGSLASSATGLHQFTAGTWLGTVKQGNFPWAQGKSDQELLALRTNPEYSSQAERALRSYNSGVLQRNNVPLTNANLYAMHHFAPDQALKFARADNNARAETLFSEATIRSNPYLAGKTKEQILGNWNQRSGGRALSPYQASSNAVQARGSQALGADSARVFSESMAASMQSTLSLPQVVAKYTANGAQASGIDPAEFSRLVTQTREQNRGLTFDAAANVVSQNLVAKRTGILGSFLNGVDVATGSRVGSDWRINRQAIQNDARMATGSQFEDNVNANAERVQSMNVVSQLAPRVQAMKAEVLAMQQRDARVGNGRPSTGTLSRMRALEQMEAQYQQALRVADGNFPQQGR